MIILTFQENCLVQQFQATNLLSLMNCVGTVVQELYIEWLYMCIF